MIHRDVKPGNLMIDQGGDVWITDFGLARLLDDPGMTMMNDVLGTIRYMSPEQALGRPAIVDHRSDVYSLGATLYELVALRPAFQGSDRAEVLQKILDKEPAPLRRLDRAIPADLETIVHKAIDKDPARRYATAGAMGEDLRRYLEHRPILARRPTIVNRAAKWARRHRPAVVLAAGFLLLAFAGLVAELSWSNRWLRSHNDRLGQALARADENAREAQRQRGIAQSQLKLATRHQHAENLRRARLALDARQIELAQEILHDTQPGPGEMDHHGFAWRYLWRQSRRDLRLVWGHQGRLLGSAVTADGHSLAAADLSGNVLIWDLVKDTSLDRPFASFHTLYPQIDTLQFSDGGSFLAVGNCQGPTQGIDVFDRSSGRRLVHAKSPPGESVIGAAFDDRRKLFVTLHHGPLGFSLQVHDLANPSATPQTRSLGPTTTEACLSPDARLVAIRNNDGIWVSDLEPGRIARHLAGAPGQSLLPAKFAMDGQLIAGLSENQIIVLETERGGRKCHAAVEGNIVDLAWSPRGRYLAWREENGRLAILEPSSGRVRGFLANSRQRALRGHGLSFSSDEKLLAVTTDWAPGGPRPAEVWDMERGRRISLYPGRNESGSATFLPGSHNVVVTATSGPRIWQLEPPLQSDALVGHAAETWTVAFSPDGKVLATGSDDTREQQTIKLWDLSSGRLLAGWNGHTATISTLAFSPDGRLLASGSLDSGKPGNPNLILWDATTHDRLANLPGHTGRVRSVAFSPAGRWLASAGDDSTVRLWDVAEKTARTVLADHTRRVTSLAFSPDGNILASASCDATMRLWDVTTGRARAILHDVGNVNAIAFAPPGSMLASANEDGEIKLWNPVEGILLRTIRSESGQVRALAFTPDGQAVAAAGKGQVIGVWDVATGQQILTLEGHEAQINALAFSPNGSILASSGHDGAVKLWRIEPSAGAGAVISARDRPVVQGVSRGSGLIQGPGRPRDYSPGAPTDPDVHINASGSSRCGLSLSLTRPGRFAVTRW